MDKDHRRAGREGRVAALAGETPDSLYRRLVDGVMDYAIYALDPEGHIATWNLGASQLKGYTAQEIVGRHFSVLFPEEDARRGRPHAILRAAAEHGRYSEQGWRRRKDGSLFWASATLTALHGPDGRLAGFAKVTRDMTDRKRQEDQLARANRDLEAFNYMVAHDLRAPIRAIEHLSSVAREEHAAQIGDDGRELLDAIHSSSARMAALVESLLAFSRASTSKVVREHVDLAALARESLAEAMAREPGRPAPTLAAEDRVDALGDPRLLRIAIDNLVRNAVKFTRRTPDARIEVGRDERDGEVVYYVADNGVGFKPEAADRLFTPFERLHATAEFEGTGLGLATVQRIVERHEGRAWAESPGLGGGARILFTLARGPRHP